MNGDTDLPKEKVKPDIPEEEITEEAPLLDPVVEELKSTKDQLLRLAAEFDNFKKRSQREKEEIAFNVKCELMKAFIPVMDNCDRAMHIDATAAEYVLAVQQGMQMIYKQFDELMASQGAEYYGAPGEPFDPNLHHAITHVEDPDLGENIIVDVYTRGCKIKDRIIREAVVGVAN
jgi:molecular chaperone GrpE